MNLRFKINDTVYVPCAKNGKYQVLETKINYINYAVYRDGRKAIVVEDYGIPEYDHFIRVDKLFDHPSVCREQCIALNNELEERKIVWNKNNDKSTYSKSDIDNIDNKMVGDVLFGCYYRAESPDRSFDC